MNLFETVKAAVTPRMAAERYGLPIRQGSMIRCPFHADRTPSMKLNEEYFYCFGCGATGDVIDLAARLFGLSGYEAAKKLAADFGIAGQNPSILAKLQRGKSQEETERRCFRVLGDYLQSCRTGRSTAPRNRRRTPSTRAMRRPAICSSASGICWTFWPAARRRSGPRWWPTCRRTTGWR